MKYLKQFSGFVNEQETKGGDPLKDPTGTSGVIIDQLKKAAEIFKGAGFGDFLSDVKDPAREFPGTTGAPASNKKIPTEAEKQANIKIINDTLEKNGFSDPNLRAAVIGIVGNETGWAPGMEDSYINTRFARMSQMFSSRVAGREAEIDSWRKLGKEEFDKRFWDLVYGYQTKVGQTLGNTEPGDGGKYRGGGFNGITGKGGYKKMQDLYNKYKSANPQIDLPSVDIVSDPDQLDDPRVAAQVCALYFLGGLESSTFKSKYPDVTLQGPNDRDRAVVAIANINAGLGNNMNSGPFPTYVANGKAFANDLVSKNMV
jgi:predicted chitinase